MTTAPAAAAHDKQAKASTAFGSRRLFDNLRDAILVSSDEGAVLMQNTAAEVVFGFTDAEMLKRTFADFFTDDAVRRLFAEVVQRNLAGLPEAHTGLQTSIHHKSGQEKVVEVHLCPIEDMTPKGGFVLAVVRQVESPELQRASASQELVRLRAEHEAHVEEVESLHKEVTEAALSTDAEVIQLVNVAVHELASPIAAMKLQVELLRHSVAEPTLGQEKGFSQLERNLRRLVLLSQDLLDAVRLEAGHMKIFPRPIDLAQTVLEVVEGFGPLAQQAGVRLEVAAGVPLLVKADPDRLAQVVTNLLQNAVKFTPRGGTVAVRALRQNGSAIVEVEDTGVGLRAEDLAKLFLPFSQVLRATPSREAPRGSGLGLFISKGIVEGHGGTIEAESAGAQQGATFRVALPLAK